MTRRLLPGAITVLTCGVLISAADAHEIGKTQVSAVIEPVSHTYQVDIVVDPDALLTRLQIRATGDALAPPNREGRDRRIVALGQVFIDAVHLKFDGQRAQPRFEYRPVSAFSDLAQAPSAVRLTGVIPENAHAFTFGYDLATGTFVLVSRVGDSAAQTFWLEGGAESGAVSIVAPPPPLTFTEVARRYFTLGFTHILPKGLDHILFVVGLFLLSTKWRSVLLQVSAFTLAHSITLGLTIYGVVSLPARAVEPMIALSIAYVAIENVITTELKSWRVALVFSFGLLHGMGFAGVLRDLGLPRGDFLTALLTFNLGVEAGQLTVVAIAFVLVAYWRRNAVSYRRLIAQPASIAIALAGLYWTVQRLL
jgi:hydrogenase/urease accessory protein HupE